MVQYAFTPWPYRRELLAVRAQFYPEHHQNRGLTASQTQTQIRTSHSGYSRKRRNDGTIKNGDDEQDEDDENGEQGKQLAVARVSLWMQRGACPHMVESTALLTAAILSDEEGRQRGRGRGNGDGRRGGAGDGDGAGVLASSRGYAVRAAYSAAFSRFVTGLLDSHQDKQRKMSMYDVAKSVGLPATFVELRHQATHEQLPSLARLRGAARKALEWIWDYYWRHLVEVEEKARKAGGTAGKVAVEGATAAGDIQMGAAVTAFGSKEEGELRALLGRYLAREEGDNGGGEDLRSEIGVYDEALLLTTLESISGNARNSGVLRRALALTREIVEQAAKNAEQMDEDGAPEEGTVKDVEKLRDELSKGWEKVKQADGTRGPRGPEGQEDEMEVDVVEVRPAWSLYEKEAWVPKPIGVV